MEEPAEPACGTPGRAQKGAPPTCATGEGLQTTPPRPQARRPSGRRVSAGPRQSDRCLWPGRRRRPGGAWRSAGTPSEIERRSRRRREAPKTPASDSDNSDLTLEAVFYTRIGSFLLSRRRTLAPFRALVRRSSRRRRRRTKNAPLAKPQARGRARGPVGQPPPRPRPEPRAHARADNDAQPLAVLVAASVRSSCPRSP